MRAHKTEEKQMYKTEGKSTRITKWMGDYMGLTVEKDYGKNVLIEGIIFLCIIARNAQRRLFL